MSKPTEIEPLQSLPRTMVGDGGQPNVFFVTDQGVTVTITTDFEVAYEHWKKLAARRPRVESALEDRLTGCLASVEPVDDEPNARLCVIDDTDMLKHAERAHAAKGSQ